MTGGDPVEMIKKNPVHAAVNSALEAFGKIVRTKQVHINDGLGSILAENIHVTLDLPPFTKSTVDGYAVYAEDIQTASEKCPVKLLLSGETKMGHLSKRPLNRGEAQYVPTGGMVPAGADCVVMIEETAVSQGTVEVFTRLKSNDNLILKGQDLKKGALGLRAGTKIYERHIGLLAAIGVEHIQVYKKPVVSILITGDELIPLGTTPKDGQIYDINSYSLKALCESYGLEVYKTAIVLDDFEAMCSQIENALQNADCLLISGGSSMGKKDYTVDAVKTIDNAQVIVHGLAFKPGKPTLIAKANDKLILGLPGHPVSSLMVMDTVGRRLIDEIWNVRLAKRHRVRAVLSSSVEPAFERDTCQMVRLIKSEAGLSAEPINGKSGMISWIGHSDGYIVAEYKDGILEPGREVEVYLWDNHSDYMGYDWV